jgi:prepilin-type N-terminal cleavage/methylation domain-containing protein
MNTIHPIRQQNRGFSLIELLAVIAIIVVLVGIVFVGMKYVTGTASGKSTQTTLGNLQSMLSALDIQSRGALDQIDAAYAKYQTDNSVDVHPIVLPTTTANVTIPQDPAAPATTPPGYRYAPFVQVTGTIAMQKVVSLPENRAALGKISTKMLPTWLIATSTFTPSPTNIYLDAWGNPIIYVPTGGLEGVTLQAQSGKIYRVQSNGMTETSDTAKTNARPFFASAGPDGDFVKGDDNIYSFEQ